MYMLYEVESRFDIYLFGKYWVHLCQAAKSQETGR